MESKKFDDRLLRILEREVMREKWRKKARILGKVIKKRTTKKGSFLFTIKTKKSEYDIVVAEYKKDIFEKAKTIAEGEFIRITGDRQAGGIIFCDEIMKLGVSGEKQIKLMN